MNSNFMDSNCINIHLNNACTNGNMDAVLLELEKVRSSDECEWGLWCASTNGHTDIARLMIAKGATNLNWGLRGACQGNHIDIIHLIERALEVRNEVSTDPLYIDWDWGLEGACFGGHIDIVNLAIKKGAKDLNWGLKGACQGGHINAVKLMIEKATEGPNGPLELDWNEGLSGACNFGNINIMHFMISQGADPKNISKETIEKYREYIKEIKNVIEQIDINDCVNIVYVFIL